MKLRNLLFATMFAVAFVGCSNDDDPIVGPVGGDGDATLSLLIANPNPLNSKAEAGDGDVSSLQVLVFDALGDLAYTAGIGTSHGSYTPDAGLFLSTCKEIKAGTYDVIVLANTPADVLTGITTKAGLLAYEYNAGYPAPSAAAPLMLNSKFYNVEIVAGKHNLIGFDADAQAEIVEDGDEINAIDANVISLYRNVAKITLKDITVKANRYSDAKLTIDSVYVLRASKKTKIAADGYAVWGRTLANSAPFWYGDASMENYLYWAAKGATKAPYIADWNVTVGSEYVYEPAYRFAAAEGAVLAASKSANANLGESFTFYAYENTSSTNHTVISIKGTFSYTVDGEPVVEKDQFYNIAIGNSASIFSGLDANVFPGAKYGVMRNLAYTIDPVITGKGTDSNTPPPPTDQNGYLDVQVKVVAYGEVEQNPEF